MQHRASVLYLLNFSILLTHQIDSAYWHEWTLFHLPGGIQEFLLLNFLLALLFLYGFSEIVCGTRRGNFLALCLATAGIGAFLIHGYFLFHGAKEFSTPVSILLILATGIVSVVQAFYTIREIKKH